jgi:S-formylglutathione hydrolase FrmB
MDTLTIAVNLDLISGWFPTAVVIVAVVSTVAAVGWHDGAWRYQLLLGIPVSFVLTVLTGLAIMVFNLVPDQFPLTFYLWAWLIWFSLIVAFMGWFRAHWALRTASCFAIVFCVLAAFTVVNQTYDYYPTLARLFGKDAAHFTDLPQLAVIRADVRRTGKLPAHGSTISVQIPTTSSHFATGPAFVYLPPGWFASPTPQLPVIELIAGIPGEPSDWTRAGYADSTSTTFAETHGGKAPILVIPDNNGGAQDTECSNSRFGNVETYLVKDVPAFMSATFNAATGKGHLAVAGLSDGGTCATLLALRNPKVFGTFASYSGYSDPTYLDDDAAQTITTLYGNSRADYLDHDPVHLLAGGRFPGLGAWFTAGAQDSPPVEDARRLAHLADSAGLAQVCLATPPGAHSFQFWAAAFKDSLPWLSWRLGLTPEPASVPAHCRPPVP